MRNTEITKEKILTASASLFNIQGFKATSLSDITAQTGLTKGAIYRHFSDKENLEACTFEFMSKILLKKLHQVVKDKDTAPEKLITICDFYRTYINTPIIDGGCPILNAGVETDDTKPGLNIKVQHLLDVLQNSMIQLIEKGIEMGQLKNDVQPEKFAVTFIAALEGGVLMSKIRKNNKDMAYIIEELLAKIEAIKN